MELHAIYMQNFFLTFANIAYKVLYVAVAVNGESDTNCNVAYDGESL